jgi:hypothetical protein
MSYGDEWFDPGMEVNIADTPERISAQECDRLLVQARTTMYAAALPRRLGPDATREELALDKRRAKRFMHALVQAYKSWGGDLTLINAPTSEERQNGAQVVWETLLEDQRAYLNTRLRYVATWMRKTGQLVPGRSLLVKLNNELNWINYAMRD